MDRPLKIGGDPTFSFLFFPFYNLVVVKKGHELLNYTSPKRGQFCSYFPYFHLWPNSTAMGEMSAKSAAEKTAAIEARMSSASPGDPRTHLKQLEKCDRKCRSLGATMLEARMKIGRACVCHALPCCLVVLCTVTVCVSDNTVTMLPPQDLVTLPSKQRSPRISFPRRSRNSLQLLD